MIPVAPTKLGPMCIPGPNDDPKAPNSCDPKNDPTTPYVSLCLCLSLSLSLSLTLTLTLTLSLSLCLCL